MDEFEPWQPHADSPYTDSVGRLRTNSELMHMHSLRSVHGSLRKISHDMEKTSSTLVEFDADAPNNTSPARFEAGHQKGTLSGISRVDSIGTGVDAGKPSIQRSSMTPEAGYNNNINVKTNSMAPAGSWEQFSLQKRGVSEPPSKGSAVHQFSQSPAPSHHLVEYADATNRMLQPIRSVPIDPSADDMTCATSAFVSRQYEALSRKDTMLEELEARYTMVLLFSQATSVLMMRERFNENRNLRERIADLEEREVENQINASEGLREIEVHAREQLQQVQFEAARQIQVEVGRMLSLVEESNAKGGVKWLIMHEERRRHDVEMESDRLVSRMMGEHLSQLQRIALEFHLYHARAQNIASRDAVILDGDEDDLNASAMSIVLSNADEPDEAPVGTVYDPYSGNSIAAAGRREQQGSSDAAANARYDPTTTRGMQGSRSYISDVLNRKGGVDGSTSKAKDLSAAKRTPVKAKPTSSAATRKTNYQQSAGEVRAEQEAEAQRERDARAERLRQTKAAAVAARSARAPGDAQSPSSPASIAGSTASKRRKPLQIVEEAERDQAGSSLLAGVPAFESEDDAEARRRADVARQQLAALGQFEPVWGWMLKSTGVLMSWQRRFFVMTKSGKIKYTAQDPTKEEQVKWVHLLNAEDITRVESDTFADTTVRPPADQYHNNCFYVDAVRSHRYPNDGGAPKTERFKFCCNNKTELNKWMWALRTATDVVYTLEEGGLVQRSPLREHFRKMYALLSPLLCSSMQAARQGQRAAEGNPEVELPTYRKRIQMEDDIAALEAQQREALLKEKQREEEEQRFHMLSPHSTTARSPSPPRPILQ